jgi:hypothetical protein
MRRMMMSEDFWVGFCARGGIFSVVGWFLWTMHSYRRAAGAFEKPQMIMQPTAKTPAQVYSDAMTARLRIGCLSILLIAYAVGVLAALSEEVRQVVMSLLLAVLGFLG